jgi:hypothetical protein
MASWLVWAAFIFGLAAGASFVAAQYRARELLGAQSFVRAPETTFAWKGVADLRGKPRAWVLDYTQIRLPGVRRVRIVVSPTGTILAVTPPDLTARIEAYQRSREP